MKILIDGRSITPKTSGISRYTDELIKGYVKHYGYENITVILSRKIPKYPYLNISCSHNRHSLIGSIRFSLFLRKQNYDIFHAGDTIGPLWHKNSAKHIQTVHDLMFLTVPNFYGKETLKHRLRILKNKLLFYLLLKDANEIITISQRTHDDVYKYYRMESTILREGINELKNLKEIKQFSNLENNSFFLYVGIGAPHKNIDFMINAFLNAHTNKKLVICGKGHEQIKSDRIIYTGWIEDAELSYLYENCAAFLFPSLYEGFGLPILEALSYNCKVISSNAGSLGEFSKEVINFFDPRNENELINLLETVDLIPLNQQMISEYLTYFDWDKIWQEFHSKSQLKQYDQKAN